MNKKFIILSIVGIMTISTSALLGAFAAKKVSATISSTEENKVTEDSPNSSVSKNPVELKNLSTTLKYRNVSKPISLDIELIYDIENEKLHNELLEKNNTLKSSIIELISYSREEAFYLEYEATIKYLILETINSQLLNGKVSSIDFSNLSL